MRLHNQLPIATIAKTKTIKKTESAKTGKIQLGLAIAINSGFALGGVATIAIGACVASVAACCHRGQVRVGSDDLMAIDYRKVTCQQPIEVGVQKGPM